MITFDGSLSGGGATLQVGMRQRSEITTQPIISYWADRWSTADYELVRASPGDSFGQAKFEALTLLISVTTWLPLLATMQGSLTFVGDALGISTGCPQVASERTGAQRHHGGTCAAARAAGSGHPSSAHLVGEKFDLRRTETFASGSTSGLAFAQ